MCIVCAARNMIVYSGLFLMFIAGLIFTYYKYYFIGIPILAFLGYFYIFIKMENAERDRKDKQFRKELAEFNKSIKNNDLVANGYTAY